MSALKSKFILYNGNEPVEMKAKKKSIFERAGMLIKFYFVPFLDFVSISSGLPSEQWKRKQKKSSKETGETNLNRRL